MAAGRPAFLLAAMAALLLPCGAVSAQAAPRPKVLMVMVDGLIPAALTADNAPRVNGLLPRAAWSMEAQTESTTISGSGWSTFLTGVHWDKHGARDNNFKDTHYDRYPFLGKLLREARPDAVVAAAQGWKPIESLLDTGNPRYRSFRDYDAYSEDYFDLDSGDTLNVKDMEGFLAKPEVDLAVMQFAELDGVGHMKNNGRYGAADPLYRCMLRKIDGEIGILVDAVRRRPSFAAEDWILILSADHGGAPGTGHGSNIPAHRTIPLIVAPLGTPASVAAGPIWPPPELVDAVPTALRHLGVALRPEWGLDGTAVGFAPTARPAAAFGDNLIFDGDAETRRGFQDMAGAPDAAVAGWEDPGWATVVAYGAPGGYPAPGDPLPAGAGRNFFAGGAAGADSSLRQAVDLSPLAAGIDAGARYELSGWLGGYLGQDDAAEVTVRFLDGTGAEAGRAVLARATAADRRGRTGFLLREASGPVPEGARSAEVRLDFRAAQGANDGYADNLSLVIRPGRRP